MLYLDLKKSYLLLEIFIFGEDDNINNQNVRFSINTVSIDTVQCFFDCLLGLKTIFRKKNYRSH